MSGAPAMCSLTHCGKRSAIGLWMKKSASEAATEEETIAATVFTLTDIRAPSINPPEPSPPGASFEIFFAASSTSIWRVALSQPARLVAAVRTFGPKSAEVQTKARIADSQSHHNAALQPRGPGALFRLSADGQLLRSNVSYWSKLTLAVLRA
jgi:hypothetical protein